MKINPDIYLPRNPEICPNHLTQNKEQNMDDYFQALNAVKNSIESLQRQIKKVEKHEFLGELEPELHELAISLAHRCECKTLEAWLVADALEQLGHTRKMPWEP